MEIIRERNERNREINREISREINMTPAQFNLTLTYGADEIIPIERMFKAFSLENLSTDPSKSVHPLRIPLRLELDPTIEEYQEYRVDWESGFDESYQYVMLMPDLVYERVWTHCSKAFPTKLVSFLAGWLLWTLSSSPWRSQTSPTAFGRKSWRLLDSTRRWGRSSAPWKSSSITPLWLPGSLF